MSEKNIDVDKSKKVENSDADSFAKNGLEIGEDPSRYAYPGPLVSTLSVTLPPNRKVGTGWLYDHINKKHLAKYPVMAFKGEFKPK